MKHKVCMAERETMNYKELMKEEFFPFFAS